MVDPAMLASHQRLKDALSDALARGQGEFTAEELAAAFSKAWDDKIAGETIALLEEDMLDARWDAGRGEVIYRARGAGGFAPPN